MTRWRLEPPAPDEVRLALILGGLAFVLSLLVLLGGRLL